MFSSRSARWRAKMLIAVLAATVATQVAITPGTARADAYGQQPFAAMNLPNGWSIPSGLYRVGLYGKGTYVRFVSARFAAAKPGGICHTTMTAEFFDDSWNWLWTKESVKRARCSRTGSVKLVIKSEQRPGFMCSSLRSGGQRITSICHAITP